MARLCTGVAGCGSMGLPMARRLLQAGHEVPGFDIRSPAEFGDRFPLIAWAREGYDPDNTISILEKDVLSAPDAVRDLGIGEDALDEAILKSLRSIEPD